MLVSEALPRARLWWSLLFRPHDFAHAGNAIGSWLKIDQGLLAKEMHAEIRSR